MNSLKSILVILLLILPFTGAMASNHHGHSSSRNSRFHVINFPTNIHHTAHATADDEFLVAEDGDGDDFSKSVNRNVTDHAIAISFVLELYSHEADLNSPPVVSVKRTASSFLRVFRI